MNTHMGTCTCPHWGPFPLWPCSQTYAKCCSASSTCAYTHKHTDTCRHFESACVAVPYVCGCFGLLSWGQDLGALLESRVMVQESTSGRARVYVRVSSSPRWRGKQPLAFCRWRVCLCVCVGAWRFTRRGERKYVPAHFLDPYLQSAYTAPGLYVSEWRKVCVSVKEQHVIELKQPNKKVCSPQTVVFLKFQGAHKIT